MATEKFAFVRPARYIRDEKGVIIMGEELVFSVNLNAILDSLEASSSDIARYIGCDRSNVCRMRSGLRIPRKDGLSSRKLVDGIYSYAEANGKIEVLRKRITCGPSTTEEEQKNRLMIWLYGSVSNCLENTVDLHSFGEKLNAVMDLAELSNSRVGRMLNVDASYISRFRNGLRSPKSNPKLAGALCQALLKRLHEQERIGQLAFLMGDSFDEDLLPACFHNWLYDVEGEDSCHFVRGLLGQIATLSAQPATPPLPLEAAASETELSATDSLYFGIKGLQMAAIRFLGNVVKRKAKEIFLYSGQNIDWLFDDPAFYKRWMSLLALCVRGGTHVCIIHNISRELPQMIDAINYWLPFCSSGMVRTYYYRRQKTARLCTTLFLCPDYACIAANNISGAEDQFGMYRYDTDPAALRVHMQTYHALLSLSNELIRVYDTSNLDRISFLGVPGFTVLGGTLSLTTMPEQTLASILDRNGVSGVARKKALILQNRRSRLAIRSMEQGFLHECIFIPNKRDLLAGEVPVDLPGTNLRYTAQEYSRHVRHIIELSERYEDYQFFVLPRPFGSLQILVSKSAVAVCRTSAPYVTFLFTNASICGAFDSWVMCMKEQYRQSKLATKKLLEKLL